MKNRKLFTALCAFALLLFVGFRQNSRQTWEYKSLTYGTISEGKLNELGRDGWELVATANEGGVNQFIFKRAK
jgi:hypothetical protein